MGQTRRKATLLFATIAAGGGHVAAARAMSEAIERYYPGEFEMRISDYMKDLGVTKLDQQHKDSWRWALRHPFVARAGQRLIDSFPRLTIALQRRILRDFAKLAAADLGQDPPLLVISSHGLITTGLAVSKQRYGLKVPVLTFATEPHNISAYWADPWADHIITPSEEISRNLCRFGVPKSKLTVVGYPVRQAFLQAPTKAEARGKLGLADAFTVVVSLGGEGVGGRPEALVYALLDLDLQVVIITGRNKSLRRALGGLGAPRLRVEGFVENMADYLAASDVVVGKAGPSSVYEALVVGRPFLVTSYAGLNERGVVDFLKAKGIGRYLGTSASLAAQIAAYARRPALLEEVRARCRALALAAASERLAHTVVAYAQRGAQEAA
jgi:UDP-N-acetylglucosamine:LPS N-acetylglucosamine transferase